MKSMNGQLVIYSGTKTAVTGNSSGTDQITISTNADWIFRVTKISGYRTSEKCLVKLEIADGSFVFTKGADAPIDSVIGASGLEYKRDSLGGWLFEMPGNGKLNITYTDFSGSTNNCVIVLHGYFVDIAGNPVN